MLLRGCSFQVLHQHAIAQAAGHHEAEHDQADKHHCQELLQSHQHHEKEIATADEHHEKELGQAERHHHREIGRSHVQWGRDQFLSQKMAEREEMRDDWDQHNRRLDSAFVAATLVFAVVVAIICEGMPPGVGDDDGDTAEWSEKAQRIGLGGALHHVWAFCLAGALGSVLLGMLDIWRAMSEMSDFLPWLRDREREWWLIEYDDEGSTQTDNAHLQQEEAEWRLEFKLHDRDHSNTLDLGELQRLLKANGIEFHRDTVRSISTSYENSFTPDKWVDFRRKILKRACDVSYPERMRKYWIRKVKGFHDHALRCVAVSLMLTLACLSVTVYARLTILADTEEAAVTFVVTIVAIPAVSGLWKRWSRRKLNVERVPSDTKDKQRRWDDAEFVRQYVDHKTMHYTDDAKAMRKHPFPQQALEAAVENLRVFGETFDIVTATSAEIDRLKCLKGQVDDLKADCDREPQTARRARKNLARAVEEFNVDSATSRQIENIVNLRDVYERSKGIV